MSEVAKYLLWYMDRFDHIEINVFDEFVEKFAERYVQQRSSVNQEAIDRAAVMDCGLDISALMRVIRSKSCFVNKERDAGRTPIPVNDIYRSDLGELLTTYYFEEKLPQGERYVIPLKNISVRERYDMPGRGLDAIGYRQSSDGAFTLLLSESKVSNENNNPPRVVDAAEDSIYKTQKKHHDDMPMVLQRLTDYVRRLSSNEDLFALGCIVLWMQEGRYDQFKITYGCGLVRDTTCIDKDKDFGKMKSNVEEFRPGEVDFAIFSFTQKTIEETVDLFYRKVQEITR